MVTPWAGRLAACLVVLLAACQTTPPPPRSATSALAPDDARERLAEALGEAGLAVARTADGLRVTTMSDSFVKCLPVTVRGSDERRLFTQADERRGVVDIRFAGNGLTTASWQTSFTGRYQNKVDNTSFERPCESTGQLEGLIVRALGG